MEAEPAIRVTINDEARFDLQQAIRDAMREAVAAELINIGKIYADSASRAADAGENNLAAHQLGVSVYMSRRASEIRGEVKS